MDITLETLILFILFGLIFYLAYLYNYYSKLTKIKSTIDNRDYYVQDKEDAQDAANLIAKIREKNLILIEHLKKSYQRDERTIRLAKNYRENSLKEGVDDPRYTSYSINKGEEIVLCLRNKNILMDINTMMFVVLHELSHLASESIGHTDEFWTNFRWILEESINIGIYTHQEFSKKPIEYCGMSITSSPIDYISKYDGKIFEGFKLNT
jgi:hypothetical protein|tara:strand:+ start:8727 stop:9353 length:627 start_codon:yes stop_codon:yes gene_type:complete